MASKPNIILILNDDMGYSDIGCYGGEIETPNLDRLARNGLRYSQFYNTARCSPSRASLLTGLHPHQTGIGVLTYDYGPEGYAGNLNKQCVTIPEVLKTNGYRTYMSGKWHVASSLDEPSDTWPMQRGFDEFFGTIIGAGSFYDPNTLTRGNTNIEHEAKEQDDFFYTDAISDEAVSFIEQHVAEHAGTPFFQYVAYTAPHWPLHAHEEDIAKYKGRFDAGWDALREERLKRLVDDGILRDIWRLSDRDPTQPEWSEADHKAWRLRCMEVYAAQIDRMDQGIGRIVAALERAGQLDNTVIIFLSDNGACAEDIPEGVTVDDLVNNLKIAKSHTRKGAEVQFGNNPALMPGGEDTYQSYGTAWANLSNAPFRLYKHWIHEGGISTPFIVHWPDGIEAKGEIRHSPGYLPDVMATVLDITRTDYPQQHGGNAIAPLEGHSLRASFEQKGGEARPPMFWEHEGNAAVRIGTWKLVRRYPNPWELYDMDADRTELNDLAGQHPDRVKDMAARYDEWAARCGVIPREKILALMAEQDEPAFWEKEEDK
ncbi:MULTISPECIES: arylsulfatase [unclassified Caballeronia]|uniref:arylsulfatase n=1 Tax=unclassified Caballeronia TaxID=2646786 RepID=UPI0028677E8E|nr:MULTISPECIES: arylsulfatase [unclassified Caballeronia]MDR5815423.1 arylsulfatase [Caballeronia sp. LZ033]MDR5821995.1 arylsulfatase [Caballeronia sp. LZ043]MDR5880151.1 arylsulfatase [Caballeronia sp. LZ032]